MSIVKEEMRNLTDEEKKKLPLELKACFMLQAWNISANIKSVDDWIDSFWVWWQDEDLPKAIKESRARMSMRTRWNEIYNYLVLFGLKDS